MTTEEFSNEFDALLSSYMSLPEFGKTYGNQSIEFDEYEKSVFLTQAQEDLVLSIYNGKNPFGDSFEKTEESREYLKGLIKTYKTSEKETNESPLSEDSEFFKIPEDVWFITYESVDFKDESLGCLKDKHIRVVPVTQDTFSKINSNPFRGASYNKVLRLDAGVNLVELISKYNIDTYLIRYITHPNPIILIDLPDGLSINKINTKTECELNPVLHRAILENAVKDAIMSKAQYNTGNR